MPLIKSASKAAVSQNISEMVKAGHPQKQAIAAALDTARKAGGDVPPPKKKAPKKGKSRKFTHAPNVPPATSNMTQQQGPY